MHKETVVLSDNFQYHRGCGRNQQVGVEEWPRHLGELAWQPETNGRYIRFEANVSTISVVRRLLKADALGSVSLPPLKMAVERMLEKLSDNLGKQV